MNKIKYIFLLFVCSILGLKAKEEVINVGVGTSKFDVYYNLISGEVAKRFTSDWDLAFEQEKFSAGIFSNDNNGIEVYYVEDAEWADVLDSTNQTKWFRQYNSEKSWAIGAFNREQNPSDAEVGFGWGDYNFTTHVVEGTSVFAVKTSMGFKKMFIISRESPNGLPGVYKVKLANLDGSNETKFDVEVDFTRNFAYFSLSGNKVSLDRDPLSTEWDLVFGRYGYLYTEPLTTVYPVVGVRQNRNIRTLKLEVMDNTKPLDAFDVNNILSDTSSSYITKIGHDWKTFNNTEYVMDNTALYLIQKVSRSGQNYIVEGDLHKVFFTAYDLNSGTIYMNIETQPTTSVDDLDSKVASVSLFENIISKGTNAQVIINPLVDNLNMNIEIYNQIGENIISNRNSNYNGLSSFEFSTNNLDTGMYFIKLSSNFGSKTLKLIVL